MDTLTNFIKTLLKSKAFRYLMSAGIATMVDILVYFITFNFILKKENLEFFNYVVGAPTISLVTSYMCGLATNFTITKLFVFKESELRGRVQLFRFILVNFFVFFANYYFMSFLIKGLEVYPTLARAISAVTIGVMSFMTHKIFSFQIKD